MKLRRIHVTRGPSLHADRPAVRLDVEPDAPFDTPPSAELLAYLSRVLQVEIAAWAGLSQLQLMAAVAVRLQQFMAPTPDWFEVREGKRPGIARVIFACSDPPLAVTAGRTAYGWISAFANSEPLPAAEQAPARFLADVRPFHLGANAKLLIGEAMRRGIPWRRISPSDMTVLLGQAKHQQRLRETLIGTQGKLANDISTNKHLTSTVLAMAGIPVPRQFLVRDEAEAIGAAKALGYPVVVKPGGSDRGTAVRVNIRDEAALRAAFAEARRHGAVLVEQQIEGFDYRVLVLDGQILAASLRVPPFVRGDGRQTLRQLIDQENRNPRRIDGYVSNMLQRITVDADLAFQIASQGFDFDSVPPLGVPVRLHGAANLSLGGIPVDVTARLHPDNRDMFIRAARVLGLDMAGVDFLSRDIGRSYKEIGGAICEVNAIPGLRAHLAAPGSPDILGRIIDRLFPHGGNGRIPIAAITGTNGKTTTSRMVAAMLRRAGHCVGLATTDGVTIDDCEIGQGDLAGIPGADMVLHDPAVSAAVLETARGGLIRNGMGIDFCDVAAVLNVRDDHLGFDGIDSREDMAKVKAVVARSAREAVVLNADDPLCIAMAGEATAKTLWWFAEDASNPVLAAHIAEGRPAVALAGNAAQRQIAVWTAGEMQTLIRLDQIPCTFGGKAAFNVENATAAAAVGLAMGLAHEAVAEALAGFASDIRTSRGRCNFVEGFPCEVVVDYAHNPDGVGALCRFLATRPVSGRRWIVLTSFGNRLDAHFHAVAAAAAGSFDTYICTTDGPRTRTRDEVIALLSDGLKLAGVEPERIHQAPSEAAAVEQALAQAGAGDRLVVMSANATAMLRHLDRLRTAITSQ